MKRKLLEASREGIKVTYDYDLLGRRRSKTVNGVTTYTIWAGQQEIADYDNDWNLLRRHVPGPGLDEIVAVVEADGSRRYPLTNKLGSVIGLVNDQGELVEKHAYNAFGLEVTRGDNDPTEGIALGTPTFCNADVAKKNEACVKDPVEAQKSPHLHDKGSAFRFAGRRYDPETGLYYNRARYYSPMLGRFLQPDPIGVAGGLNLYAYANNNPVSYTDPMGDIPTLAVPALMAGGGALLGLAIRGGMDLYRGELSSFGAYAGAAVSGGIAGWGLKYNSSLVGAGFGAGAAGFGNVVEQGIDLSTGLQQSPSVAEFAIATSVGAIAGGGAYSLPPLPKRFVPFSPYAKGMLTKMEKGIVSQISARTALKIFGTKTLAEHAIPGSVAEELLTDQAINLFNSSPTSRPTPVMGPRK